MDSFWTGFEKKAFQLGGFPRMRIGLKSDLSKVKIKKTKVTKPPKVKSPTQASL